MRNYQSDQDNSVLFDGEKAKNLIDLRKQMDQKIESICSELNFAIEKAEKQWSQLSNEYGSQFQKIVSGTDLESVPVDELGFDFSKASKYHIVFGQRIANPLQRMFMILRSTLDEHGYPSRDELVAHPKAGFSGWGTDEERLSERETETV